MAAALAYVLSERTACWRTQTPGVAAAGESTVSAWCYSPRRTAVTWGQDGDGATAADVYCNDDDDDLASPIPGAELATYPQVPDADAAPMKRYHEIEFTFSVIGGSPSTTPGFTALFGVEDFHAVVSAGLPNNPASPTIARPQLYQARQMVPRTDHVAPSIAVRMQAFLSTAGMWRLHAIDIAWQPESARSLRR